MSKPLALTWGDPAGIGGEIACKAWRAGCRGFVLIADAERLAPVASAEGVALAPVAAPGTDTGMATDTGEALPVLHHPFPAAVTPGRPDGANAAATIAVIRQAVTLAETGAVAGVVTNPISKEVLITGAGFAFPGHTEFLADLTGAKRPIMMLAAPELRVVPVTIHIPLSSVATALTPEILEATLRLTDTALRQDFGLSNPRIAVAGLNPHAGEGGILGREERDWIIPLLERLRAEGLRLAGPAPADTLFHAAARARYDVAICMYHDQALVPLKTLNFAEGVNITCGLPIVRTSPDHGTAFDIAGQGKADPRSLIAAIAQAREIAETRARTSQG